MEQKQPQVAAAAATAGEEKGKKRPKKEGDGEKKRARLSNMVFYDGKKHPASVLHELRPDAKPLSYVFEQEPKENGGRFHCRVSVDTQDPHTGGVVHGVGVGRSKQLAKNMAAQQALMVLYPTYRPPVDAMLCETSENVHTPSKVSPLTSLRNEPRSLLDHTRKHLTTLSITTKTPLQLFHELFLINGAQGGKNKLELIKNDENLFLVRATAMEQEFWGISTSKSVAQNEAAQLAIEALCKVSFQEAKAEFLRALRSMNKIKLPVADETTPMEQTTPVTMRASQGPTPMGTNNNA